MKNLLAFSILSLSLSYLTECVCENLICFCGKSFGCGAFVRNLYLLHLLRIYLFCLRKFLTISAHCFSISLSLFQLADKEERSATEIISG